MCYRRGTLYPNSVSRVLLPYCTSVSHVARLVDTIYKQRRFANVTDYNLEVWRRKHPQNMLCSKFADYGRTLEISTPAWLVGLVLLLLLLSQGLRRKTLLLMLISLLGDHGLGLLGLLLLHLLVSLLGVHIRGLGQLLLLLIFCLLVVLGSVGFFCF